MAGAADLKKLNGSREHIEVTKRQWRKKGQRTEVEVRLERGREKEQALVTGQAPGCRWSFRTKDLRVLTVGSEAWSWNCQRLRNPDLHWTYTEEPGGLIPKALTGSVNSSRSNFLLLTPVYLITAVKCATIRQLLRTAHPKFLFTHDSHPGRAVCLVTPPTPGTCGSSQSA